MRLGRYPTVLKALNLLFEEINRMPGSIGPDAENSLNNRYMRHVAPAEKYLKRLSPNQLYLLCAGDDSEAYRVQSMGGDGMEDAMHILGAFYGGDLLDDWVWDCPPTFSATLLN